MYIPIPLVIFLSPFKSRTVFGEKEEVRKKNSPHYKRIFLHGESDNGLFSSSRNLEITQVPFSFRLLSSYSPPP